MLGVYTWSAEAGRAARVAEAGESTTMKKADFEMVRSGDEENNGESPLSASVMNPMSAPPPAKKRRTARAPLRAAAPPRPSTTKRATAPKRSGAAG